MSGFFSGLYPKLYPNDSGSVSVYQRCLQAWTERKRPLLPVASCTPTCTPHRFAIGASSVVLPIPSSCGLLL
jgi:hypothetical protein